MPVQAVFVTLSVAYNNHLCLTGLFLGSPRVRSGHFNPLTATLKPQSNGPAYSNTVIGKLAVDVWAVTFGTARKAAARPGPSSLYQM